MRLPRFLNGIPSNLLIQVRYNACMSSLSARVHSLLTSAECRVFDRLDSPERLQAFLDDLPLNFEDSGDTYYSPRRVLALNTAHCLEGALFAAAVLAYHGERPLLMDFQTLESDTDHVVALFRRRGLWGAISKTNHSVLRYRDPVYRTPRELAMSYFHEYFDKRGTKSLVAYSAPFDLSRFNPERWLTSDKKLDWLVEKLDFSRHYPAVSQNILASLGPVSAITHEASRTIEWRAQGVHARQGEKDGS